MVLIVTLCFRLQEITTPALGAPPLLNREGNYPEHIHLSRRAAATTRLSPTLPSPCVFASTAEACALLACAMSHGLPAATQATMMGKQAEIVLDHRTHIGYNIG
jgi:hypothetical protein